MAGGEWWFWEGSCCVASLHFFIDSLRDSFGIVSGRFVVAPEDGVQNPIKTNIESVAKAF